MSEEKDPKPDGKEHDFSEFAKHKRPDAGDSQDSTLSDGWGGSAFLRGCGITLGVVALIFFFILGTCFLG